MTRTVSPGTRVVHVLSLVTVYPVGVTSTTYGCSSSVDPFDGRPSRLVGLVYTVQVLVGVDFSFRETGKV